MQDIKLKSGNILRVGLPPIRDSLNLVNTIAKSFSDRGLELKLDRDTELDFKSIFDNNKDACIKGLSDVIFNQSVLEAVLSCAERCIYVYKGTSLKITLDLFDKEDYRGDFYEIMIKIAISNIRPFFSVLLTE
jgi:hypothetical protein